MKKTYLILQVADLVFVSLLHKAEVCEQLFAITLVLLQFVYFRMRVLDGYLELRVLLSEFIQLGRLQNSKVMVAI